ACAGEGKAIHAEYVAVPRNLVARVPPGVTLEEASFGTIGAIALHGFRQSGAKIGESVCVIGVGLVGNVVSQIAKAAGCKVIAIDQRSDRLSLAKASGITNAFSSDDPRLTEHISALTDGAGADKVIICAATGSSDPVNQASRLTRDRGRVTIVGRIGMDLERKDYYQKELEVSMSRSLGPGRYDPVYEEDGVDYPIGYVRWTLNRNMGGFLGLVAEGSVDIMKVVGARFPVTEAPKAYGSLKNGEVVAVLLEYVDSPKGQMSERTESLGFKPRQGRVEIALVGPGNFAKEVLIPSLRGDPSYDLRWLVSSNPLHAKQLGERYRFQKCSTSFEEPLADPEVKAVFISTPNNLHFPMVVKAARAGKVVFVEKPLCLSGLELNEIQKVQTETGARIVVGFNRRYAPLAKLMKKGLDSLDGPMLINYRVNADFIPRTRWVQDPQVGGGRVIAECCHFVDFFNFLTGLKDPQVGVTCVGVNGTSTVARDNIVATLKYGDGSVANLTYSALGNRELNRERVEAFKQGTAFVLDDFKSLHVLEPGRPHEHGSAHQDKGHKAELVEIAKMMRGEPNEVVSFEDVISTTLTTLEMDRLTRVA
ncbi:MAG TPA: bi-domain-containing oxidoreductase, partial [Nitrososphaerales archaeon]|nr:bi-domain-containing oxidoreductase [Nitrososphaerales archaeon]